MARHNHEAQEQLIPARMLNEFVYCPRLFYLEWVQGEWEDNADTLEGSSIHKRTDSASGTLPEIDEAFGEHAPVRSVLMSAPALGLIARMDVLEFSNGLVYPVDYKKGSPSESDAWLTDKVQLCAQGLILRENGYRCEGGYVFYVGTRQRVYVPFDEELITFTRESLEQLRQVARQPVPPPPLEDSPKCPRCSLVGICLPDETHLLQQETGDTPKIRRLVPSRNDRLPLYVLSQGSVVKRKGAQLLVQTQDDKDQHFRLIDLSRVSIFGNVQITTQAIRALVEHNIPVFFHSYAGRMLARLVSMYDVNAPVRVAQFEVAADETKSLAIARAIVTGKIKNQRTLLRRNQRTRSERVLRELSRLAREARRASSLDELLGIEGAAARLYFRQFSRMLRHRIAFDFKNRNRRPPKDPVNAMLSFLYALLLKDAMCALMATGLDPYRGIFHQMRFGRPSLALDLMEEFRPLIADSVVLRLVNTGAVTEADFIVRGPACAMKKSAMEKVIEAYEQRMNTILRHPVFGYAISYRRTMEVQARLLSRVLTGELPRYIPVTTR